jgi:gentisate 1,2-dioxygenase
MVTRVLSNTPAEPTLEDFNEEVRRRRMVGYWMLPNTSDARREPIARYKPMLWEWSELSRTIYQAAEIVPKEIAYRRFVGLQHPDLELGTAPNYYLGCQLILAGERAPAHRHTMDAVRFVVEGDGSTHTVIDGERFPMRKWDLVTTPNFCWHDHVNGGVRDTIWLDAAVSPLIRNFGVGFAEVYRSPEQPVVHPEGWSRTAEAAADPAPRRAYRYAWEDTRAAIDARAQRDPDPCDDTVVAYADPRTGGPTLATLSCDITRLRPGWSGAAHRHVHATTYNVLSGSGRTTIGDVEISWKPGDTFVVPIWAWHRHENLGAEEALLFGVDDSPIHLALGFARQEQAGPEATSSEIA